MQVNFRPTHEDISDEMCDKIENVIDKYRDKSGGVTQILRESQTIVGYLPLELIDYIADSINLPKSDVFGIASFYSLFSLKPKGRHIIKVCIGTACYVKGIREVLRRLKQVYNLEDGETTPDRRFSLESVRCLGACGLAPVMVVDEKTYGAVTPDKVLSILEEYY